MVIKTEVCAFSDTRIYPGHGVRMIRRDGQVRARTMPRRRTLTSHHTSLTIFGTGLGQALVHSPGGERQEAGSL